MRTTARRRRSTAAAALLIVLGACSSSTSTAAESRPPRPLNALEAASEDVIDQVPRGRWTRIDRAVGAMQRDWRRYHRAAIAVDARQVAALDRALRHLATNAGRRDALGTQQAANDVSAPVVELLDHYALGHPVQVGRLDVIGRQIVIDVLRSDDERTDADVDAARREWSALRASVRRHHGGPVAQRCDRLIERLLAATTARDGLVLRHEANDLLELVDRMERLYRR